MKERLLKVGDRVWVDIKAGDNSFHPKATGRGFGIVGEDMKEGYSQVTLMGRIRMDNGEHWCQIPLKSVVLVPPVEEPEIFPFPAKNKQKEEIEQKLKIVMKWIEMAEENLSSAKRMAKSIETILKGE